MGKMINNQKEGVTLAGRLGQMGIDDFIGKEALFEILNNRSTLQLISFAME